MTSRAPRGTQRSGLLWLVLGVACLGTLALIFVRRSWLEAVRPAAGWTLVSGTLVSAPGAPAPGPGTLVASGRYVAVGETRLGRGRVSFILPDGASVEVGAGSLLPRAAAGNFVLEAAEPFTAGGLDFLPVGLARLLFDPEGFVVDAGEVRTRGRAFRAGERGVLPEGTAISSREADRVEVESPTPGVEEAENAGSPVPGGRVIDAGSGQGIGGARVIAVYFQGAATGATDLNDSEVARASFDAALAAPGAAAFPALEVERAETAADGSFTILALYPDDPRLGVHLEVDHPLYAPATAILAGREDASGRWQEVEVRLRRAATARVTVVDEAGTPISDAPLRVVAHSDGHDFVSGAPGERVAPSLSANGRIVRADRPELRFTDHEGAIRLPFTEHPWDLELLHPRHYLYLRDLHHVEMRGRVQVILPWSGPLRLLALASIVEDHLLLDLDGEPVPLSEVEVALEGMPPFRLRTGDEGWFTVGVWPNEPQSDPVSYHNPRRGILTVLTPELLKRSVPVAFPSITREVVVGARKAPRIRLRVMDEAGQTVEPVGLSVSRDWTLVRLAKGGEMEYQGALPPPGSFVDLLVNGFLPARAVVPAHGSADRDLDLGDVPLAHGLERDVVLVGGDARAARGAVVVVGSPAAGGWPARRQKFAVGEGGRARVGGLLAGVHSLSVEGPFLNTVSEAFEVDEASAGEPIEVQVELAEEEDVVVAGVVGGIEPFECARCQVVERYRIQGAVEPLTFAPYPLAPDGAFGSARRLRGVQEAQVVVVTPTDLAAEVQVARREGPPVFDGGEIRLRKRPRAEISFYSDGLGRVMPPLGVRLEGQAGLERIARLGVAGRRLVAHDLRPGSYSLRWLTGEGAEEIHPFNVPLEHTDKVEGKVMRSPLAEESVEILVTDAAGAPLERAVVSPAASLPPGVGPGEPGVLLALVRPRAPNQIQVSAEGFLTARIDVGAGGAIPNAVSLLRGTLARAVALDPEGRRIEGDVTISWETLTPSAVTHGEPVKVPVKDGRLEASGLPPVPLSFTFRLEGSELAVRLESTLPGEKEGDFGTIRFEETRRLLGRVLLPDGVSPAREAIVALVPRAEAYRLPFRIGGIERAVFSTRTDSQGGYRFDALPLRLAGGLAIVAHLHGFQDAIEDPLDPEREEHDFVLDEATSLAIDMGYGDGVERKDHGFWLEYARDPSDPDTRVELGELPLAAPGGRELSGIEPGRYRVKWGLREPYEPIPGLWREAEVHPGVPAAIALRLEGRTLRGQATLNGVLIERGWILITDDPGGSGTTSVGRIVEGEYSLIDPPPAVRAYGAVIPERKPQPFQNIPRGEALPVAIDDYRSGLRDGRLRFDYKAYNLTLELQGDYLARYAGCVLSLDYYEWKRNHFEAYPAEEPIESPTVRLGLLRPGPCRIAVRSHRGTLLLTHLLQLKRDEVIVVR